MGYENIILPENRTVTNSSHNSLFDILNLRWEYCVWRHNGHECEFEWKRTKDAIVMQSCMGLHSRVSYTGNYDTHECQIEVRNTTSDEDAGNWACHMESYVFGKAL